MRNALTLTDALRNSVLFPTSFTRNFFCYLAIREGVMMNVYRDSKGILTWGIGHRLLSADRLGENDVVPFPRVMAQFYEDMISHKSNSIYKATGNDVPKAIGMASWIWTHGPGDIGTDTWNKWMKGENEADLQARMKANWDLHSPVNQERNRMDVEVCYPRSKDGVNYHFSSGSSGTYVYVPLLEESFYSLQAALEAGKKKVLH